MAEQVILNREAKSRTSEKCFCSCCYLKLIAKHIYACNYIDKRNRNEPKRKKQKKKEVKVFTKPEIC